MDIIGLGAWNKLKVARLIAWLGDRLQIAEYKRPITLEIKWKKNHFKKTGNVAEVFACDDLIRSRHFEMIVDADPGDDWQTTQVFCHEMVHVMQSAKGRHVDFGPMQYWNGQPYDLRKIKYNKRPWEIEAHELEDVLAEGYYKEQKWI